MLRLFQSGQYTVYHGPTDLRKKSSPWKNLHKTIPISIPPYFLSPTGGGRKENYGYCKTATAAPKNASFSSADTNRLPPTFANHSAATFVNP